MAEPQNLRFRQFKAFFALVGKKNQQKKVGPILHVIFNYLSDKKKLKSGQFYGILGQKKGKIQK